jgi:hypothetical protein
VVAGSGLSPFVVELYIALPLQQWEHGSHTWLALLGVVTLRQGRMHVACCISFSSISPKIMPLPYLVQ